MSWQPKKLLAPIVQSSFSYLVRRHSIKIRDFNNLLTGVAPFRLFASQLFRAVKIATAEMWNKAGDKLLYSGQPGHVRSLVSPL